MTRNLGIILRRNNPTKSVYSILDKDNGVIVCSVAREDICTGACIEYTIQKQHSWILAHDVELIGLPFIAQSIDLLLFHKALEICSLCMPPGSTTQGVFEHMQCLYDNSNMPQLKTRVVKKIFLCKLFILLGFYPHEKKFQSKFFHSIATQSIDNLESFPLSIMQEKGIEEWLQSCMAMHMQEKKFKTRSIGEWMEIV